MVKEMRINIGKLSHIWQLSFINFINFINFIKSMPPSYRN